MKRGQFTPTRAQEARRAVVLRSFNKPFPAFRGTCYTGAIWAGLLIPRQLTDESAQRDLDMACLADMVHRHKALEYRGIYSALATDLTTEVEGLEMGE